MCLLDRRWDSELFDRSNIIWSLTSSVTFDVTFWKKSNSRMQHSLAVGQSFPFVFVDKIVTF